MTRRLAATFVGVLLAMAGPQARQSPQPQLLSSLPFEVYLESMRQQAGIPGLSGVIILDGEVVWERGLGFQNAETRVRATPDTPYLVADLSQTVAAALLLQCVEWRVLDLDERIRTYGVAGQDANATLRQLLSHTAGGAFRYDPERFTVLTELMVACAPQPYRKTVSHRILEHLAMRDSVPGRDLQDPNVVAPGLYEPADLDRYQRVLERLAVPYKVDQRKRATRTDLPVDGISAAGGLVSTARDLARFDRALDTSLLLEGTRTLAFTNVVLPDLSSAPTGLGWFVQTYRGERIVWHYGLVPNAYSSLILKVPSRRMTVILLANSDGLTGPFQLHLGDVTRSIFANLFLRLFV